MENAASDLPPSAPGGRGAQQEHPSLHDMNLSDANAYVSILEHKLHVATDELQRRGFAGTPTAPSSFAGAPDAHNPMAPHPETPHGGSSPAATVASLPHPAGTPTNGPASHTSSIPAADRAAATPAASSGGGDVSSSTYDVLLRLPYPMQPVLPLLEDSGVSWLGQVLKLTPGRLKRRMLLSAAASPSEQCDIPRTAWDYDSDDGGAAISSSSSSGSSLPSDGAVVFRGHSVSYRVMCSAVDALFVICAVRSGVFSTALRRGEGSPREGAAQLPQPPPPSPFEAKVMCITLESSADVFELSEGEVLLLHDSGVPTVGALLGRPLDEFAGTGLSQPLVKRLFSVLGVYREKVQQRGGGGGLSGGAGSVVPQPHDTALSSLTAALAKLANENRCLRQELGGLRAELRDAKVSAETDRLKWESELQLLRVRVEGVRGRQLRKPGIQKPA